MNDSMDPRLATTPVRCAMSPGDIPALTGLRLLAAFSVALAHGADISLRMDDPPRSFRGLTYWVETGAGFGMTLFFVLSGFVIHYNYRDAVRDRGVRGIMQFLWARFARLYPLFIVMVVVDLLLSGRVLNGLQAQPDQTRHALLTAFPYLLTFTLSWIYKAIGPDSLIYAIGTNTPLTWSISTEWFFYLCYPFVMWGVIRASRPAGIISATLIWCVAWACFAHWLGSSAGTIDAWATAWYGPIASMQYGIQDSFVRWLLYFSPYVRIGEFILGCLVAQIFMVLQDHPIARWEQRLSAPLAGAALVSLPVALFLMFNPTGTSWLRLLQNNFGLGPSAALLIFCAARYRLPFLRVLSSAPLVRLGNASYSIYLTHMLVFAVCMTGLSAELPPTVFGFVFLMLRLTALLAIVVLVSPALFAAVEDPARRWLRALWARPGTSWRPAALAMVPLAGALLAVGLEHVRAMAEARVLAVTSGIAIQSATYGGNCGAASGNATTQVRAACNSRFECDYVVDVHKLGDPANGCGKAFSAQYQCVTDPAIHSVSLPGEAGLGSVARLHCPMPGATSSHP